ncbi:MAG: LysM peptidoglycan-binding domain-containing protein [Treponemataceae bacterium]
MASSIGIKIANGEFYPVLEEGSTVKKRLVLTTVHDGQRSVQIDLYRSDSRSMADAAYIGSLVVENIADKAKGEPSIELVIGAEGPDVLSAEAVDLDASSSGARQRLSVLLQAMEDGQTYDVPDFELEGESTLVPPAGLYEEPDSEVETIHRAKFPVLPVVIIVLIVLLIGGALAWFFIFNKPAPDSSVKTPVAIEKPIPPAPVVPTPQPAAAIVPAPVPPAPAKVEPVKAEPAKPAVSATTAKSDAAARRVRSAAPVKSYKVPKTIPRDGFKYRVRWGDTLWDISEAFYRNPWQYPRIARFNKIRNPDLIFSGSFIRVPPKK